jgi:hypothetical protein
MPKAHLEQVDMRKVSEHYDVRLNASVSLNSLLQNSNAHDFAELALGMSEGHANYSASEHSLGPRILANVSPERILHLGRILSACNDPKELVRTIYQERIPYLKIAVGSEIAMLLQPDRFWVSNTRSIWAHLLIKHDFEIRIANEELRLYREQDTTSEMDYQIWKAIYPTMRDNLIDLGHRADKVAEDQGVTLGDMRNIWHDAIANALYEKYTR